MGQYGFQFPHLELRRPEGLFLYRSTENSILYEVVIDAKLDVGLLEVLVYTQ
jgi:hypothetical protein